MIQKLEFYYIIFIIFWLCIVDGVWSNWESWETCPVTCGSGSQSRYRNCTYKIDSANPAPYGNNCTGSDVDTQTCNNNTCPGNKNVSYFCFILYEIRFAERDNY
jgi:hypothetical protein